ncbi:hypothetical protein ACUNWD_05885 [Sunxiuqinia sp. A32]|uniref:hypothetical protein n=1 Tax=Sunxiuqinia sp. A32 TaxID=3461496 RepID=UPI00404591B8
MKKLADFYCDILNFEVLGRFENHDDYNGIFLGIQGFDWHLEFTESSKKAEHQFDEDDLLVFYPKSNKEYKQIILNINSNSIEKLSPANPYWKNNGIII